jgi:hypothetical protein
VSDNDYADRIEELMAEASRLDYGPTKAALLEEAVRLADSSGDVDAGFRTRQSYMDAANFAGHPDQMVVAFSWCLAQADRNPDKFSETDLLWKFKWVLSHLPEFPQVHWEQITSMLADMTRRYEKAGSTLRAIQSKHRSLAMHRGDRTAAREAHKALLATPRDWLSDCPACELDGTVDYLFFQGSFKQGVEAARPILAGRHRCAEVPHRTYARVLVPLLRLGLIGQAVENYQRGYRLIARNPGSFVYALGNILDFLTLTDNLAHGTRVLEKHLSEALICPALTWRIDFYLAARMLLERLAESGQQSMKLRLPSTFPAHRPEGEYDTTELERWFAEQAAELARRFDQRNGTPFYTEKIAAHARQKRLLKPFPLKSKPEGEGPPPSERPKAKKNKGQSLYEND